MHTKGFDPSPGAFGENLVIDGIDTERLGVGSRLRLGPALLELTEIGKVCDMRGAISQATGDCVMSRTGLFGRVLEGGEVSPGMPIQVVHRVDRSDIQAAVISISNGRSKTETVDATRQAVASLLHHELGAHMAWQEVVPNESAAIREAICELSDRRVDLIITLGGTGMSVRDVTPEATRDVIDHELPGLGEAMRAASATETPNAWLSRATAGVRRETLIVNLPERESVAVDNLVAILPTLRQAAKMLRRVGNQSGCA